MIDKVTTVSQVKELFPHTPEEVRSRVSRICSRTTQALHEMISLSPHERTFANTIRAYDNFTSAFGQVSSTIHALEMVHPEQDMRDAAHQAVLDLQAYAIEHLAQNKQVYQACKEYVAYGFQQEQHRLTAEEKYYIDELMKGFRRGGLDLPDEQQEQLKALKKELAEYEVQFETNINTDSQTLSVSREALAGVGDDFVNSLARDDKGLYILRPDYPTQAQVMKQCVVEETRKQFWLLFNKRGYPANEVVLNKVIALRDKLARALGYESYAALDIDDNMARSVPMVESFLQDLVARTGALYDQEVATWKSQLPAGISLAASGNIKPWDLEYIKHAYKTAVYDIDEIALAQYFPMERTVAALLDIYQKFFDVVFVQRDIEGLWHSEVQLIEVQQKDGSLMGYLLLDLYPRPFKYTHACQIDIVPTVTPDSGEYYPGVALVLANFPKPTAAAPSLLLRNDVITFFHEFGHAMHSLLGSTRMVGFSGTRVKMDFVEMPSQMFEEWMWDAEMLKKVSCHYQTGNPLDEKTIARLREIKNYDIGDFLRRQLSFGLLSLAYYAPGEQKDVTRIKRDIFARMRSHMEQINDEHFECSFGHLMGYGAKYYGYLWSKVYALDLFEKIKKGGLLNPQVGAELRAHVLGKGGSEEPEILLREFLGREPRSDAFFADLGL